MGVTLVLGALYGDEGKGRVSRELAREVDVCCRAGGGPNASHTIYEPHEPHDDDDHGDRKWVLRQVPSGVFEQGVCLLGDGMLVDVIDLHLELSALEDAGLDTSQVFLSAKAHAILPRHQLDDSAGERTKGEARLGTTKQGMGPAVVDKVRRVGVRIEDLFDPAVRERVVEDARRAVDEDAGADDVRRPWSGSGQQGPEVGELLAEAIDALAPRVRDCGAFLRHAVDQGADVLVEGAQAALLDLDHGCYPHVTSSSPTASGVLAAAGLPPTRIDRILGICRTYATRQARGFFPTEIDEDDEEAFRQRARDWAIRVGWLDLCALRYAAELNGFTGLVVTRLDSLVGEAPIQVCVGYDIDGQRADVMPGIASARAQAVPVYEELSGWGPVEGAASLGELPAEAKAFLEYISAQVGVPVVLGSASRSGPLLA